MNIYTIDLMPSTYIVLIILKLFNDMKTLIVSMMNFLWYML